MLHLLENTSYDCIIRLGLDFIFNKKAIWMWKVYVTKRLSDCHMSLSASYEMSWLIHWWIPYTLKNVWEVFEHVVSVVGPSQYLSLENWTRQCGHHYKMGDSRLGLTYSVSNWQGWFRSLNCRVSTLFTKHCSQTCISVRRTQGLSHIKDWFQKQNSHNFTSTASS